MLAQLANQVEAVVEIDLCFTLQHDKIQDIYS